MEKIFQAQPNSLIVYNRNIHALHYVQNISLSGVHFHFVLRIVINWMIFDTPIVICGKIGHSITEIIYSSEMSGHSIFSFLRKGRDHFKHFWWEKNCQEGEEELLVPKNIWKLLHYQLKHLTVQSFEYYLAFRLVGICTRLISLHFNQIYFKSFIQKVYKRSVRRTLRQFSLAYNDVPTTALFSKFFAHKLISFNAT